MRKCLRPLATVFLLLIVSVSLITGVFATVASGQSTDPPSPFLSDQKPVLNYLLSQEEYMTSLIKDLSLTDDQVVAIEGVLQIEAQAVHELEVAGKNIVRDESLTDEEKRQAFALNDGGRPKAIEIAHNSRLAMVQILTPVQNEQFTAWIDRIWNQERERRDRPVTPGILEHLEHMTLSPEFQMQSGASLLSYTYQNPYSIYATQYDPGVSGSREASLPDKYVKFAVRGWRDQIDFCWKNAYPAGDNYTVNVYSSTYDNWILNVQVNENGPYSSNDDYYDPDLSDWACGDTRLSRRWPGDLERGRCQAHAAYYWNHNGGYSELGQYVTNPACLDLSREAATELGYTNPWESRWVTLQVNWMH